MKRVNRTGLRQLVREHTDLQGGDTRKGVAAAGQALMALTESVEKPLSLGQVHLLDLYEAFCDPTGDIDKSSSQDVQEAMMAANFPTITGSLIHPVIMKEYEPIASEVLSLVTEIDSKHQSETHVGFGAMDSFELVREGQTYEDAQQAERKCTIPNFKFGRTMKVTMEMVLFDQTGDVLRTASGIGKKAALHLHKMIVQRITEQACTATGQVANSTLVVDGTARTLFANDHSTWDRLANDNYGGGSTLSTDNLTTVLQLFNSIYDDKGDLIMVNPNVLLVGKDTEITAKQVISTPNLAWVDGSGAKSNNPITNPHLNAYRIVASPFVQSGAWYIGDFNMQYLLQWVYKMKTETQRGGSENFSADVVAQYKAGYFCGVGALDYRYVLKG